MRTIYRVPIILLTTAAAVSLGVIGVHASTQCVRFVQQKLQRQRHHKVTAATAARWKEWNKAHPNWHPKRTPGETLAQIDFACKVPVDPKGEIPMELPNVTLGKFAVPVNFTEPPAAPPVVVANNTPTQDLFPSAPGNDVVNPSIYPPESPVLWGPIPAPAVIPPNTPIPPPASTPEPAGWVLMATAMAATVAIASRRRQAAAA